LAVLTISRADWSSTRWSNALRRIRMFCVSMTLAYLVLDLLDIACFDQPPLTR
jgi:hypothetical protein